MYLFIYLIYKSNIESSELINQFNLINTLKVTEYLYAFMSITMKDPAKTIRQQFFGLHVVQIL